MKLVFGDYRPDLPDYLSPGLSEAINLYPTSTGYIPVGQFQAHTEALPNTCRGASAFISPSGRVVFIAGTRTALYKQEPVGLGWTLLQGGFDLPEGARWRFAQFGSMAIVTNHDDDPVKVNLDTDAVTPLGGTPPKMQAMAVVQNFLVGTQTNGSVTQVAWSGENDAEWWTYASRKSDYNDFADGGEVTGIVGGDIGLILQRTAVRRMAYVGGNILFRFDKISSNIGCATVHSVAQHGELAFWYSDNGFQMWDGAQIKPIGFERVDAAFASLYGIVDYNSISTAVDGQRNTVIWSTGNRMWLYNWALDKWSMVEQQAEIITSRLTRAPSVDETDPAVGEPDDDLEYPDLLTFDAARFQAGDPRFYVFSEGTLGVLSGDNMAARVTGRQIEMIEGRDARIRRIRPMTDATDGITVRLDCRQRLGDSPRRSDFSSLSASGEMPVRARGRFVKARVEIAEGSAWSYLQGIDATLKAGGAR